MKKASAAALLLIGVWVNANLHPAAPKFSVGSVEEARILITRGLISDAKRSCLEELAVDPAGVGAIRSLAYCALAEGDRLAALSLLRSWTELDPACATAWKELARALRNAGRGLEAGQALRRCGDPPRDSTL